MADLRFTRRQLALIALCVVVGAALRVARVPEFPGTLQQDEAAALYESFSLLSEGTDAWGHRWPMYFLSWGSGQNVLLSYLSIPFLGLLGPVPLAIRIVPILSGIASIALIADVGRRWRSAEVGVGAAVLTALLPWPVMISRWGIESNLLPFCLLFAHWLFLVAGSSNGRRQLGLTFASGVALGLCGYAYSISLFMLPIIVAAWLISFAWQRPRWARWREGLALALGFAIMLFPLVLFVAKNHFTSAHYAPLAWLERLVPFSLPRLDRSRLDQAAAPLDETLLGNLRFVLGGLVDGMRESCLPGVPPLGFFGVFPALLAIVLPTRARGFDAVRAWAASTIVPFIAVPLGLVRFNAALFPLILLFAETCGRVLAFRPLSAERRAKWWPPSRASLALAGIAALLGLQTTVFVSTYFDREANGQAYGFYEGAFEAFAAVGLSRSTPLYMTQQPTMLSFFYPLIYLRSGPSEFADRTFEQTAEGRRRIIRWHNVHFDRSQLPEPPFAFVLIRGEDAPCANPTWLGDYGIWSAGHCDPQ